MEYDNKNTSYKEISELNHLIWKIIGEKLVMYKDKNKCKKINRKFLSAMSNAHTNTI